MNDMNVVLNGPVRTMNRTRTEKQQETEIAWTTELESGTLYIAHSNWLDFKSFGYKKPIYLSMVRDPIDRVVHDYYKRHSRTKRQIYRRMFPGQPLGHGLCGGLQEAVTILCGNHLNCLPFNSPHAVQEAKSRVEKEYSVVGTWEEKNITLTVLEKYVPRFFNHARFLYKLHSNSIRNRNRNNRKPRVDPDVREMVRRNFTNEYEFYYFCKQRLFIRTKRFLHSQMSSLNVRDLNNTRLAQMELVFFNRVPKVGSQTFMELLRRLSERNNFQFHRDAVQKVETIRLAEDQQQEMAEVISELPEPSVFIKHVCFTNFTKFNLPKPIYLNVVRDPVERVISWFYYVRAPWYFVERKAAFPDLPLPHPAWLKKDFETCVLSGDQECTYTQGVTVEGIGDHRRQSLFFCGHDYECTPFNTVGALEKAKFAVEQQYAVVGVLEDLNTTLSVLEKYVPRFFEGVRDIYATSAEYLTKINKNNFKPPVSESVKDIVRRNFTNEIEFYQFCRQRLHKQYLAAHLPQRIITDSAHQPGLGGN
ncbi:GL20909 [Drosophila persimilis]|uniref:GL20909 n=1 Tax=Drosophila persimilis TaxID=7234 RepID=B4H966_DROPE|nr:GL20909 [Drosophila persimilis]